ncbi:MAG: hypothetical protein ACKVPY_15075 [Paracoccaceae bacterium]
MNTRSKLIAAPAALFVPVLAFAAFTIPARADDPAMQPLHLVKECSQWTGQPGDYCSIIKSDLEAIPVGTRIFYYGPLMASVVLSSIIVIDAGGGSTAIGNCSVNNTESTGTCSFWAGSGALRGFQALVTLSVDPNGTDYHWDGSYAMVN